MRACVLPALLVAATFASTAAGTASAQEAFALRVDVEDLSNRPVPPLAGIVVGNVTVSVPCALVLSNGPNATPVELRVASAPEWATVTLVPASLNVPADVCRAERATVRSTFVVSATADGEALVPKPVVVKATVTSAAGGATGEGTGSVTPDYFSVVDVAVAQPIRVIAPGDSAEFSITIGNRGNGATRVTFTLNETAPGWVTVVPDPVEVASRLTGPSDVTVRFTARAPSGEDFYVNSPTMFTLRVTPALASDASRTADASSISMIVTVRGFDSPAGAPVAALAGIALAAFSLARRNER